MTNAVRLAPVVPEQRTTLARLWQLYKHDLSQFRGSMPDDAGLFKAGRLPSYFDESDRFAYLIHSAAGLSGFALIRREPDRPTVLGEFFIVRAVRRQRVGHEAAVQVIGLHPGRWEIAFQEENAGAARFWRRVGAEVAGAAVVEERRGVPGKPEVPPDTWMTLHT